MKPHIITLITLGVDDVAAQELAADSGLHLWEVAFNPGFDDLA